MIKNRMKEFRAKYDMKQEDLAQAVGVRRETIGNLEKGKYNPSLVLEMCIRDRNHNHLDETDEQIAYKLEKRNEPVVDHRVFRTAHEIQHIAEDNSGKQRNKNPDVQRHFFLCFCHK